jgi:8-oxo-dGTP pyrophosphatase MutT (NUDIX family)
MTHSYTVLARYERFRGPLFDVVSDEVAMPDGERAVRDYMRHVGAVGVVALDDAGQVVLVRQYRHPVRRVLWELPAGLLDAAGEAPVEAAARELAEEVDLAAARWDLLIDLHTSPGCSSELIRVFLARELTPVPADRRHRRRHEEAELTVTRMDLDRAVDLVLAGEITNATCCAGLLAAARARAGEFRQLRSVSEPLP